MFGDAAFAIKPNDWKKALEDPVRVATGDFGLPDLDKILRLFPPLKGEPAFYPEVIARNIGRLRTVPEVNTGHPFLDRSVKTGLACIDATFQGDHPKYGVDAYAKGEHDSFPPTIIAAVDALSAWGLYARAAQLFRYWLSNFVCEEGTINYYGASISEYGQLLHMAARLEERGGIEGWWGNACGPLNRLAEHLLSLRAQAEKDDGLIPGSPEADECDRVARYFHNNAWAAKGLRRWADLCERQGATPTTSVRATRSRAAALAKDTLDAIRTVWPQDPGDRWVPPQVEPTERPHCMTATRLSSYTNYRYWPELLSSGLLPPDMANQIVEARLHYGGQFCGMTRFRDWLDDWPLAEYLHVLWSLGRRNDFLLSLYGHIAYHQAEGHLTAYEQVTFPPGEAVAPYCLPCQLVAARAARLLIQARTGI
jgi:hypothetical protein